MLKLMRRRFGNGARGAGAASLNTNERIAPYCVVERIAEMDLLLDQLETAREAPPMNGVSHEQATNRCSECPVDPSSTGRQGR